MFTKFVLSHHIGDRVAFETKYYKGSGRIGYGSDGKPIILTEHFSFAGSEIKKIKVIK